MIYLLFKINTANLVRDKLYICKEYHIQPSEIDKFAYYEYEQIKEEINLIQKEQEKQQKKQEKEYGNFNTSSMMNSMKSNMDSMKGSFSMPNINIPNI